MLDGKDEKKQNGKTIRKELPRGLGKRGERREEGKEANEKEEKREKLKNNS